MVHLDHTCSVSTNPLVFYVQAKEDFKRFLGLTILHRYAGEENRPGPTNFSILRHIDNLDIIFVLFL